MSRNNNDKERLKHALSHWQDMPLPEQPRLVKTFTAGLNHDTHLISSRDEHYVLKLFSKPSPSAISMQKFAAAYLVAPEVLYVNPDFDLALLEYVNSDTPSQPFSSQNLLSLARGLRRLHTLSANNISQQLGDFNLLAFYEEYLTKIDTKDTLVHDLHRQLKPILKPYLTDTTEWCLCHNDLVQENCFIVSKGAIFIDWEYAQRNNPWFDLAAIIYYCQLDIKQSVFFLNAYQTGWESKVTQPIYYSSQCALLWADILWHLTREEGENWSQLENKVNNLKSLMKRMRNS